VYLFKNAGAFHGFMSRNHPGFPNRRAFFVQNETSLMVYAYWGDRVAEDLRHEVTHGYLHSVIPGIPLWLDEGIAEYFETPVGSNGLNEPHVRLIAEAIRESNWRPDLPRLETMKNAAELTQLDYAEAWLWVHFLLNEDAQTNSMLCQVLQQYQQTGTAMQLGEQLHSYLPDVRARLISHLRSLADQM
jgi:hypothetical protein